MRKRHVIVLAGVVLLAASIGCLAPKNDSNTLKIGVLAELTGSIPAVGASCKNAALLAAEQFNAAGGITIEGKKHQVQLLIEDTAAKPEQAAAAAQKLIAQDKVLAIIGPNCSSNALPASEIAEDS